MNGAAAGLLPCHRALQQQIHRRRSSQDFVGGHHRGNRAGAAAANPARQRQTLMYRERDSAQRLEPAQQLEHRRGRGVLHRIGGQPAVVAVDCGNRHARRLLCGGNDDITWFVEGKPEHVEAAADI
jgi:hypothetical protein